MREWLVIESAYKRTVFRDASDEVPQGYIPRDVAEPLLGRKIATGGDYEWFTREEGEKMRAHPEWTVTEPPERPLVEAFPIKGNAPARAATLRMEERK